MTRPIKENEQWKLDGIFSKCSRMDYCNKPCTKLKRRKINQAIDTKRLRI